jgi:S1-C subfamily serine protease
MRKGAVAGAAAAAAAGFFVYERYYKPWRLHANLTRAQRASFSIAQETWLNVPLLRAATRHTATRGSGFAISPTLVLTNAHCVAATAAAATSKSSAYSHALVLTNGASERVTGRVLHCDTGRDLALVRLDTPQRAYMRGVAAPALWPRSLLPRPSSWPASGSRCFSIRNRGTFFETRFGRLTFAVQARNVAHDAPGAASPQLRSHTMRISPGWSGSAVVQPRGGGHVLGINSFTVKDGGSSMGVAIPLRTIRDMLTECGAMAELQEQSSSSVKTMMTQLKHSCAALFATSAAGDDDDNAADDNH